MRILTCLPAILCLSIHTANGSDLTTVDRTIAKEPVYQTKAPRYGLLVFGPEAKTRIWLVQDGDTLYVDRSGHGDLTQPANKVKATPSDWTDLKENTFYFEVGDVHEGSLLHRRLLLSVSKLDNYATNYPDVKTLLTKQPSLRGYTLSLDVEMPNRKGIAWASGWCNVPGQTDRTFVRFPASNWMLFLPPGSNRMMDRGFPRELVPPTQSDSGSVGSRCA
jgi:hypothetical protein